MTLRKKIFVGILVVILTLTCFCTTYICDYYHADDIALSYLNNKANVSITVEDDGKIIYMPNEPKAGLIFYPGAKVENEAYSPLLFMLAEKGICCIAVPTTLRIPILSVDAANGIKDIFPEISEWYIGGHSLGGSVAAMYLVNHPSDFKGLILLSSYSISDLKDLDISVLTIYGENDEVLNMQNYIKYKEYLPKDTTEVCVVGGCHSYFGSYGLQKGDGEPTISPEDQWNITIDTISKWIGE